MMVLEVVRDQLDAGIDTVLGQPSRAMVKYELDHDEQRRIMEEHLRSFAQDLKAAARPEICGIWDGA